MCLGGRGRGWEREPEDVAELQAGRPLPKVPQLQRSWGGASRAPRLRAEALAVAIGHPEPRVWRGGQAKASGYSGYSDAAAAAAGEGQARGSWPEWGWG